MLGSDKRCGFPEVSTRTIYTILPHKNPFIPALTSDLKYRVVNKRLTITYFIFCCSYNRQLTLAILQLYDDENRNISQPQLLTLIRQAAEIYHHVTGLQREFTRFGNVFGICAVVSHSSHTSQLEFFYYWPQLVEYVKKKNHKIYMAIT